MIRLQQGGLAYGWWMSAFDRIDIEPPSKQVDTHIFDLEKELPPLLYERYCILKLAPSDEWVKGIGKILRYSNDRCQLFIYEEE